MRVAVYDRGDSSDAGVEIESWAMSCNIYVEANLASLNLCGN